MLKLIPPVLAALKAGQELKDPAKWKQTQNVVNACAVIITAVVAVIRYQVPDLPVTDAQIIEMASIAAAVLALINSYITTATSKKIGL